MASRNRHDAWLERSRRLARRPRALLLRLSIVLLLVLVLPALAVNWLLLPPPQDPVPGETVRITLPVNVRKTIERALAKETPAEIARIKELEFITDPYVMLPPRQAAPMAARDGDSESRSHFNDFRFAYARSGCSEGRDVNEAHLETAREALQAMDLRLSGLAEARLRYHQGLIGLCDGDFAAARSSFAAALAPLGGSGGDSATRQYRVVARVGAWLAERKADRDASAPLGRLDMSGFTGRLCSPDQVGNCDHFDNRSTHLLRATLTGLLAGSGVDPETYQRLKRELGTNVAALGPQTVANLAAAAAIHGDAPHIGTLMRGARRQLSAARPPEGQPWINSNAAARLVNLAWITGHLASDDPGPSQWFLGGADLPITKGFEPQEAGRVNRDIKRMAIWKELAVDRALLLNADFEQFSARANGSSNASSEDRRFLAEVRSQMLKETAPALSDYTDKLARERGGEAARATLLRLLRTKSFPVETRLDAASRQRFGLSFRGVAFVYGLLVLLALVAMAVVGSLLAGYARAFPRRHYDDRTASAASARAAPAPASGASP